MRPRSTVPFGPATRRSFRDTLPPIVATYASSNWSNTKRRISEVFPTALSPSRTTFFFAGMRSRAPSLLLLRSHEGVQVVEEQPRLDAPPHVRGHVRVEAARLRLHRLEELGVDPHPQRLRELALTLRGTTSRNDPIDPRLNRLRDAEGRVATRG